MRKPEKIYQEDEKKKFNYDKPEGWDKKPPLIKIKEFKPTWWQILKNGLSGEDMEPKYFMRYEGWMHELKVICMTIFVGACLASILFNSSLITTSAMNEKENEKETWFDKGLDYVMGRYDEWRGVTPIVKPDTIYQVVVRDTAIPAPVPLMTQQELDSIIATYNQRLDSARLADSTSFIR